MFSLVYVFPSCQITLLTSGYFHCDCVALSCAVVSPPNLLLIAARGGTRIKSDSDFQHRLGKVWCKCKDIETSSPQLFCRLAQCKYLLVTVAFGRCVTFELRVFQY